MAATVRDEIDARSNQTGGAELLQNIGGELLGHFPRASFIERSEIHFADQLRGAGIGLSDVEQVTIKHDLVVLDGRISERKIIGVGRRAGPIRERQTLSAGRTKVR